MALRTILAAGGACALVAGVVVAGSMAGAASMAPAASAPPGGDVQLASAVLAASDDTALPTSASVRALGAHRDLLCARVPNAIVRTQNLQKRLAGDASTQGSLAWLQAKIDKAQAAHEKDQLVTVLENRLAFRKELASFLPHRLELLQKAQETICAPAPAASPSS
jgi:hypothetical protein